ncbi:MAG: hypothetical protein EP333_02755 [Bacteroidetes bacterium]|nr:MAG: hypothetical protein EP333_02755 [Bacteroidota bacterium]
MSIKRMLISLVVLSGITAHSQDVSNNRLKVETEPGLFFNNGRSLNVLYNVLPNNDLGIGFYVLTTDVPNSIADDMIKNYNDSSVCRITQEYAISSRYILRFAKNIESNPYVGFISGWENFQINRPGFEEMNIETFFFTPHIGYELYAYKKIIYINAQIRVPIYFMSHSSNDQRPESMNTYTLLPSLSFGARF